jgi:hypothetical protein
MRFRFSSLAGSFLVVAGVAACSSSATSSGPPSDGLGADDGAGAPHDGANDPDDAADPADPAAPGDPSSSDPSTQDPPSAPACAVTDHLVPGSSDFYAFPTLAVDATGAGLLSYGANGASTGALVSGTYLQALGAGGAPQGSVAKLGFGLETAAAPAGASGYVAVTGSSYDPGFTISWLDASGAATRTVPVSDIGGGSSVSFASSGGITYAGWVVRAFDGDGVADAIWLAGYTASGEAFAPEKVLVPPGLGTDTVEARLVTDGADVWLVYSGASKATGVQSLAWAKVSAAGELAATTTASFPARADHVLLDGDDLVVAWTGITTLTGGAIFSAQIRAGSLATGAATGTLSLGSASASYDSPALAQTASGYALAVRTNDPEGYVQYLELTKALAVSRTIPVTTVPSAYTNEARATGIATTPSGAYVAYATDADRKLHVARVACP